MTWLERHDPQINLHRFYAITVSRDLFGAWLLIRSWGRVGTGRGQSLVMSFGSEQEALRHAEGVIRSKQKRGYVATGNDAEGPVVEELIA